MSVIVKFSTKQFYQKLQKDAKSGKPKRKEVRVLLIRIYSACGKRIDKPWHKVILFLLPALIVTWIEKTEKLLQYRGY